jgi:hypothetical protein
MDQAVIGGSKVANYTFQQPPKSIGVEGKYRDPNSKPLSNIMHDRRVVRGNTYASQVVPVIQQELGTIGQQGGTKNASKKSTKKKEALIKQNLGSQDRPHTPEAVEGRKHIELQTEQYLEALTDAIEEATQETQTDPMLDRPPTPIFVPFKSGRDAETQIDGGDLFDFDTEVEPLLEVMVGKTLEQAMLEVLQEEELEAMRQQQLEFEQRRKEEAMESQRLEAAEKRKFEEKERRKRQEMARIRREKEAREKLEARILAKSFLGNLENRVFARLEDEGWFFDAVEREVELEFMPWLLTKAEGELEKKRKARDVLDMLIRDTVAKLGYGA